MADVGIVETVEGGVAYRAKEKLTVEEYLHFIDSHKQLELPVDRLREIIEMHGFGKLRNTPKRLVLEAVASLELMDPGRSTLQDDTVSSHVHLTVEEVIKDLAELKWQECCVTSLQTFNGGNRNSSQVQFQRSKAPAPHNKERGIQKKQKRNSIASYTTDIIHVGPPGNDSGGESRAEQSVSCTSVADAGGICRNSWPQLMQRSKRCP